MLEPISLAISDNCDWGQFISGSLAACEQMATLNQTGRISFNFYANAEHSKIPSRQFSDGQMEGGGDGSLLLTRSRQFSK